MHRRRAPSFHVRTLLAAGRPDFNAHNLKWLGIEGGKVPVSPSSLACGRSGRYKILERGSRCRRVLIHRHLSAASGEKDAVVSACANTEGRPFSLYFYVFTSQRVLLRSRNQEMRVTCPPFVLPLHPGLGSSRNHRRDLPPGESSCPVFCVRRHISEGLWDDFGLEVGRVGRCSA